MGGRGLGVRALLLSGVLAACTRAERPPDVVIVVVDTLRADHLGQYGYGRATSPALDVALADATRFTQAWSTSSWTAPATASLLTGLYPPRHGTRQYRSVLHAAAPSLAESLRDGAWRTLGVSHNANVSTRTRFDQGFATFVAHEDAANDLLYPDASAAVDTFSAWLPEQGDAPIFAFFQLMNTHGPYRVPEEHRADLLGQPPSGAFRYNGPEMDAILDGQLDRRAEVTPQIRESLVDQYDTAVRYTTAQVARLLDVVRARGAWDDTLVVVTADHGEELFDRGGFSHGFSLAPEVVRVPLWVKLPGQAAGGVVDTPVSLVDVAPTVLEVTGRPAPLALDGVSLVPLLRGAPAPAFTDRALFAEVKAPGRCEARALLRGRHRVVATDRDYQDRRQVLELFDVVADPTERRDLAATEGAAAQALLQALLATSKALQGEALPRDAQGIVDLDAERMRALGYAD